MKIETTQEKLKTALKKTERMAGKNLSLPILSNIFLKAKDGNLTFRSTNLDMGVEYSFPVKVDGEGEITIPAVSFSSFIGTMRGAKTVVIEGDGGKVSVTGGGAHAKINALSSDDFPTIPKADGVSVVVEPNMFVKGLKSVNYSAASGNLKPELCSVSITQEGEELVFAATDSFRLAEKKVLLKKTPTAIPHMLIPAKNTVELVRLFENEKNEMKLFFGKGQFSIETKSFFVTSRVIDGAFPDYKQIMPVEFSTEAILLREDLLNAIKITTFFSDRFNQLKVRVVPEKNICEVVAKNGEYGEAEQAITAKLSGVPVENSFNHRFIADCLSALQSESVALRFSGENKPLLISSVGDNSFRYIVMPMNK